MAEYIDRDEALNAIERSYWTEGAYERVERIPAADVVPVVHGRWEYYHKQNKAVCTNCSFERDLDADFGRAVGCPNCWAKMDATDINVGDKEG